MTPVYICDYIRTPIGRFGGSLSSVRADDLAAVPLRTTDFQLFQFTNILVYALALTGLLPRGLRAQGRLQLGDRCVDLAEPLPVEASGVLKRLRASGLTSCKPACPLLRCCWVWARMATLPRCFPVCRDWRQRLICRLRLAPCARRRPVSHGSDCR